MTASLSQWIHEAEGRCHRAWVLLLVLGCTISAGAGAETLAEPQLLSVFPIGGQAGTSYRAAIRGRSLEGAYALWFDAPALQAEVVTLEDDPDQPAPRKRKKGAPAPKPIQRLEVEIRLAATAALGKYSFRVITPRGLSNPLALYVHREEAVLEQGGRHELPPEAQPLSGYPTAIHGRIHETGEVDYYSFKARKGEELLFEAFSSDAMDSAIALYEPTGSWFSPDRATRLAFHDEPVSYPGLTTEPALTYRFPKDGDFLVRVNGFWGDGGPDHSYVLRIAPSKSDGDQKRKKGSRGIPTWKERTWTRKLDTDRMKTLWFRAVPELAPKPDDGAESESPNKGAVAVIREIPVVDADAEPTKAPVEPPEIPLPALVVGTVERPGDIDRVRFSIKEGDRLALEVETPAKTLPLMNPYLRVVDGEGVEVFTNVHSSNAEGVISKQIQPKAAYAFPRDGEFTLEIRDIAANYGDPEMRYRVLVRPQVPHMGEVHVAQDHLNLVAGQAKKLSVITDQEEGYDGFVVLSIEGLPEGIRAVPATEVEPDSRSAFNAGKIERFTTKSKKATFVFLSEPDAPATRTPLKALVYAQPVVEGKLGARIPVKELLIMVVRQQDRMSDNQTAQPARAGR